MDEMRDSSTMDRIAKMIDNNLPDGFGFIVLAFPFGANDGRRLRYASNAARSDAINALKEWLIKCGHAEDWMKHIQ